MNREDVFDVHVAFDAWHVEALLFLDGVSFIAMQSGVDFCFSLVIDLLTRIHSLILFDHSLIIHHLMNHILHSITKIHKYCN